MQCSKLISKHVSRPQMRMRPKGYQFQSVPQATCPNNNALPKAKPRATTKDSGKVMAKARANHQKEKSKFLKAEVAPTTKVSVFVLPSMMQEVVHLQNAAKHARKDFMLVIDQDVLGTIQQWLAPRPRTD